MTTTFRTLRLEYSLPPEELRGNSRAHWAVRYPLEQKMRDDAMFLGLHDGFESTFAKARITFLFYHWMKFDVDNFAKGMKYFTDGLKAANVFPDDDSAHLKQGAHDGVKCKKGEERVDIFVEEIA